MTVTDLAVRTGLSERGIGNLDRGVNLPRPATALVLAAALGCRPADLREGDDA